MSVPLKVIAIKINDILDTALQEATTAKKDEDKIRIRVLQAATLLEILGSDGNPYHEELQNGLSLLNLIVSRLESNELKANYSITANLDPTLTTVNSSLTPIATERIPLDSNPRRNLIIEDEVEHKDCNNNRKSMEKNNDFPIEKFISPTHHSSFQDIVGCEKAKQALQENVVLPLCLSDQLLSSAFTGIRAGSGNVLLHGPPGTGKTLLAQATASEANAVFVTIRPSDILSKFHGESEKFIAKIFTAARSLEKVVLFIDEFDSIASSRVSMNDNVQSRRILSELLLQLSAWKSTQEGKKRNVCGEIKTHSSRLAVIAATNRLEDIDEAIVRRFECKVLVGIPGKRARKQLIQRYLEGLEAELSEQEMDSLASLTFGWSGSDIETLTREAAMIPLRELHYGLRDPLSHTRKIQVRDFEKAHKSVVIRSSDELGEEED